MNMRTTHACALAALVAVPASVAGLIAGCGSTETESTTCLTVCADSNSCPNVTTMVDCTSQCADDADLNLASGCTDEYKQEQTCVAKLSDPCTSTSACAKQLSAYTDCVQAYCVQTPNSPQCNAD
jgi:hypothetical protein